ncbi:MurR/RpiR family transcriptional regulator [Fervidobacterium pennivorans subsp. shakshaketiis]|jgi:DNA-binding MurR/RpiR family transcriptional regulator|uniref:Transcriptional regulator n=1 Tax=Fervidobacterium pennivorans (strain DSM 9078 / Ven5) TaxID=771875 RepID=H9UC88_FERPD|nr:MurR/RpiR family transcriptional regulator [Fervidobacterium pennivorans]AFG35131.1 transcriptional regulator [Fervidobacterium pennivorans DSM 9078]
MAKDIFTLLTYQRGVLTKKEKIIAQYVLENVEEVVHMSITELSELLGVGEGTIVRFCQKLGFQGFHSFKIFLAKSIPNNKSENGALSSGDILSQIKINHVTAIEQTYELLSSSKDVLMKCAEIVSTCRKLYTVGVGASGATALDAYYKFMRIGIDAFFSQDAHLVAMVLSSSTSEDVLLTFSQSGSTSVIIDLAKLAKENNTKVIAVTGHKRSPLADIADYVLLTPIREAPFESGAIRSKISQLHVLEALFEMTKQTMKDKATQCVQRTARAVEKWIY